MCVKELPYSSKTLRSHLHGCTLQCRLPTLYTDSNDALAGFEHNLNTPNYSFQNLTNLLAVTRVIRFTRWSLDEYLPSFQAPMLCETIT